MIGPAAARPIVSIGHGTLGADGFAALVRDMGVDMVVDVRRHPGSRRWPHFAEPRMAVWLPEHGIRYWWLPALGGRRTALPDSRNVALRNDQFRGYADHMATQEFRDGIAALVALADDQTLGLMCAESVWWHCHRRLIADYLVVIEQRLVEHGFHDGRLEAHQPLQAARRVRDTLVYDAAGAGG